MNIIQAENNYFLDGEKIGFTRPDGSLQMAPGMKTHRDTLKAFIAGDSTPAAEEIDEAPAAEEPEEPEVVVKSKKGIPPCPPQSIEAGDKTPEVIAWYFKYHPEQAAIRYANRKFTKP
jgi:hypothetical protein